MPTQVLVWFKRDLRLADHAPLAAAAGCDAAAGLYVIEPDWLGSPEFDAQHLQHLLACLAPLRADLAARGLPLLVRVGAMAAVLGELRQGFNFSHLRSHEATARRPAGRPELVASGRATARDGRATFAGSGSRVLPRFAE